MLITYSTWIKNGVCKEVGDRGAPQHLKTGEMRPKNHAKNSGVTPSGINSGINVKQNSYGHLAFEQTSIRRSRCLLGR